MSDDTKLLPIAFFPLSHPLFFLRRSYSPHIIFSPLIPQYLLILCINFPLFLFPLTRPLLAVLFSSSSLYSSLSVDRYCCLYSPSTLLYNSLLQCECAASGIKTTCVDSTQFAFDWTNQEQFVSFYPHPKRKLIARATVLLIN